MAIKLIYYNIVIPKVNIERVFPGGFDKLMEEHEEKKSIGRIWCDDYLYRDGAMGPEGTEMICKEWENIGLKLIEKINGEDHWKDLCVVDFVGGPTLPCEWLVFERPEKYYPLSIAYLKNKPKGEVIGK